MNAYNRAVKMWNDNKKTIVAEHVYAMPKKGTIEHGQVMAIAKKIMEGPITDEIVKEIIRTHKTPYMPPRKEKKGSKSKEIMPDSAPVAAAEPAVAPVIEKKARKPRAKKEKAPEPAPMSEPAPAPAPEPEPEPVMEKEDDSADEIE